jgi:hypothetical protein
MAPVCRLLAGGMPGQGVEVEGVKGVKNAPMPPGMYENGEKTGGFPHFSANKLPKTRLFAERYLTRCTPELFFENTLILQFFIT